MVYKCKKLRKGSHETNLLIEAAEEALRAFEIISEQLEEIRCGVIDVESVCEKILSNTEGYDPSG